MGWAQKDREGVSRALRSLRRMEGSGCYLGISAGRPVFGPSEQCLLVLGPPRSGKTSGIVVPNVLAAAGAMVVSTKRDVLDDTFPERSKLGRCLLYDPSGKVAVPDDVEAVGWSPLVASKSWSGAVAIAESMVGAARPGEVGAEAAHWSERASALLSALLHGGALEGAGMDEVVASVNRREPERPLAALRSAGLALPIDLLEGILQTDARELSGIWSTASSVLSAYRTEGPIAASSLPAIDFDGLISGEDTLYVVASSEHQRQAAPLVAGLVRDLREQVYARAVDPRGAGAKPPVLLVLDELANIAPLHDLPELVSEGGSQGLTTLACLQDLSQARARWGPIAEGFATLFGSKVVLGGLGDARTLREISLLTGDHDVPSRSTTRSGFGARSTRTEGTRRQPRLPPDAIAALGAGRALVVQKGFVTRSELPQLPGRESPPRSRRRDPAERGVAGGRDAEGREGEGRRFARAGSPERPYHRGSIGGR